MTGTHDLRNRVAAYYRGGHSMRETATRFGITFPEVRRILRRDCPGDIRPRLQRSSQREARDRAIVGHYRKGHGVVETATRFGLSTRGVRLVLKRDCPGDIRPRHRPSRPQKAEAEYRRARAAERTRQNMEIERSWPEREAFR